MYVGVPLLFTHYTEFITDVIIKSYRQKKVCFVEADSYIHSHYVFVFFIILPESR